MKIAQAEVASGNKILALTVTSEDNELEQGIVPDARTEPLQSLSHDREKEAFHTISCRSAKPAQEREKTWYTTAPTFSDPLNRGYSGCAPRLRHCHP